MDSNRRGRVIGATLAGTTHRDNEDAWGAVGDLAWVVDGASQPSTADTVDTAAALARRVSTALMDHAGNDAPLKEIVRDVIEATVVPGDPVPTAALALIRRRGPQLDWLLLGDASIILPTTDGAVRLSDARLSTVAVEERKAWAAAATDGSPDAGAVLWQRLYDVEQAHRNTDGGYWVIADTADAAGHAMTGTLRVTGDVVLATDGVIDGIGIRWPDESALHVEVTGLRNPDAVLAQLRADLLASGRTRIDDAALVLCRA